MHAAGRTSHAVATAGSFSGVAEGTFYAANLKNNVTINANATLCAQRSVASHMTVSMPVIGQCWQWFAAESPAAVVCSAGFGTSIATNDQYAALNPTCRSYGTLVGEPVILVSTGIGPGAAIICLAEVLFPIPSRPMFSAPNLVCWRSTQQHCVMLRQLRLPLLREP
jgi:hypothetical protein